MRNSKQKSVFKPPPPAKPMPSYSRKLYPQSIPPPKPTNPQPLISNPKSNTSSFSQSLIQGMSLGAGSEIGRRAVGSILDLGTSNESNNSEIKNNYQSEDCNEFLQKFKECILNSDTNCDEYIQKFKQNC